MALSTNPGWHFWVRLAGLTGLLTLAAGLVVLWEAEPTVGMALTAAGGALAGLALLFEVRGAARLVASQRGALGSNVALQIVLAVVLLVGLNAFAFWHHQRFDWTRDSQFTIPAAIREQLAQLRGDTRIIVCQRHTAFGQLADKPPDSYDAAAERRIVDKVRDLAEQFQELGPRFHVEVLDNQEKDYAERLTELKKESPQLGEAIDGTPESSLFFFAEGKVQRLSFHDVYQLDKQASQEANGGRGNLVLRYQGAEPFARRVLNIDEKKPRLAVGVIIEFLGLEGSDFVGMGGVKKALAAHGFEGRDIILKNWNEAAPEPAVLTYDESKYERLEEQLTELEENVQQLEKEVKQLNEWLSDWQTKPLKDLAKHSVAKQLRLDEVDEGDRRLVLAQVLRPNLLIRDAALKQERQDRDTVAKEKAGLNVENLSESRRITDLRAKFNRMLAQCDLLLLPRMTLFNVADRMNWPYRAHSLDNAQIEAIKDFIKSGKPVLFCLGPSNEPASRPDPFDPAGDRLNDLLGELGVKMPKQTILFNVESKSFAERRSGFMMLGPQTEVPAVEFDWPAGAGRVGSLSSRIKELPPNPIRASLRLTARSVGKNQALDLRLRHPRPVYYQPGQGKQPAWDPVFMMTSSEAWNESQPFPTRERVPRFELPKPNDPDNGTIAEKRRGQFPIAVALETQLPSSWYEGKDVKPATVRLAVIGHGGIFMGEKLTPAKEKVLLDVSNWLLGRDDLLAHDNQTWEYPRVELSDSANGLWQWGTRLGMPVLCMYAGLVVLMVRRMR